jgi:hypothetical protein
MNKKYFGITNWQKLGLESVERWVFSIHKSELYIQSGYENWSEFSSYCQGMSLFLQKKIEDHKNIFM